MNFVSNLIVVGLCINVGITLAQDFCNPSPCGENTDCSIENGTPVCSCKDTFTGNPLSACKHECEKNEDCEDKKGCFNFRCKDLCPRSCGDYAVCLARNNQAICTCPYQFAGDPYTGCIAECTSQEECPSHLACIDLHCGDVCKEKKPCKGNTDCKVERHIAICSCRQGYVSRDPLNEDCRKQ